jgi:hypothetical protein
MCRAFSPEDIHPSTQPFGLDWYVDAPLALRKEESYSRISPDG